MTKKARPIDVGGGRTRSLWKGMAAGLAGGLAASWVTNQFQEVWSGIAQDADQEPASESSRRAKRGAEAEEEDDTTMKVASVISQGVFGHKLTRDEKKKAGPAVHYAFGGSMGALYGAMAEFRPEARSGRGTLFSTMVWLAGDGGRPAAAGSFEIAYRVSTFGARVRIRLAHRLRPHLRLRAAAGTEGPGLIGFPSASMNRISP